jgi:hypothetical protein
MDNTKLSNEKMHETATGKKPYKAPTLRRLSDSSVRHVGEL